jgi:hypothetical protein
LEVYDLRTGERIEVSEEESALLDYIAARPVGPCFRCEELIPENRSYTCRHCLQDFDEQCILIHQGELRSPGPDAPGFYNING